MRPFVFLALILTVCSGSSALAANVCDAPQDQTTMNECAAKAFKAADARLNADYNQIMKRLGGDADAKKGLTAAQRAWVTFRDAECAFQSSGVGGGSIYPMIYSGCLQALTNSRVDQLKSYLKCEEGDMSCPVPSAR